MLTMQEALARLAAYWADQGCLTVQPMNTEVGAGTLNPATALRVLGPEPWRVAYVEPSVRPDDSRYGSNPNRMQTHTQFQVILKPEPGNPQELFLGSLEALGIDVDAHDVRFVEDNWASPALGAWGLGWEVWLDGLEITQFTYFQHAGGINLDPVSVEITYGIERILMALQGVRHFKDITYAPGVAYGEVVGQAEYEMSRYYLDDASVAANQTLLETYAAEAQRMVDAGLPIPAHVYVLKMSHAFNVLDSRGAVSTAERASEFARMRRLSHQVAKLWVASREKEGFPLGVTSPLPVPDLAATSPAGVTGPRLLVFEIGVEEMPPAEAEAARIQVATSLAARLEAGRIPCGSVRVHATPRRIVAVVDEVAAREIDQVRTVRGPRVSAAYGADGKPTRAAEGFAKANATDVTALERVTVDGVEYVAAHRDEPGRPAVEALTGILAEVGGSLRSSKNMRWNDPNLSFTRPIRWLLGLLGDEVVPTRLSNLVADRYTWPHRTAHDAPVAVTSANGLLSTLADSGIIVDQEVRRQAIVDQAIGLATTVSGQVDVDAESALLNQITFLVEQPTAVLGDFEGRYLDLPEPVLTMVMRKHQRYLPVRDAQGALLPYFIAVANGIVDIDTVRAGNQAVLRARFEDAAFFYRADLALSPADMRGKLASLTFTEKLGSMSERADRIAGLANGLAANLPLTEADRTTVARAAELAKFDLGSQMVVELTALAGTMAREYALAAGETPAVAQALFEMELPRSVDDRLPATVPGAILAFADRLDAFVGLTATVGLPTGSSDPFAVRRAALGLLAIARHQPELHEVSLGEAARTAALLQPVTVDDAVIEAGLNFLARRLEQTLVDEKNPVDRVRAVIVHAQRPRLVDRLLDQVGELSGQPEFLGTAKALQRARRIVPDATPGRYDEADLVEPAEVRLHDVVRAVQADLTGEPDLVRFTAAAGRLVDPVEDFFNDVLVMTDDERLRRARLGLLAAVRDLGAGQIAWSELQLG